MCALHPRHMRRWRTQTGLALRALASPVFVFSLVVLILNDHVVKQAWPGWVSGKVSDVAGLVVAPLLLAVLLTALRLPRPVPVALALTGLGLTITKAWETGATFTSAVWSLTGIPTQIRADPTDLLALPALYAAWWVHRTVRQRPTQGWRHLLAVAVGTAALPCGLLATAATSCDDDDGFAQVGRVAGRFPGSPPGVEERLMLGGRYDLDTSVDATRRFAVPDVEVVGSVGRQREECDPANPAHCWRIVGDDAVLIETSEDRGRTWQWEYEMDEETRENLREQGGAACGEGPAVTALDLGVLPAGDDPVVVVAVGDAGVLLRQSDASWTLMSESQIGDALRGEQPPTPSPLPRVTPVDQPSPSPTSPASPSGPDCPSPSPVSVTPDPRNGPPTTYYVCS